VTAASNEPVQAWRDLYDLHERQGPAFQSETRVRLPGRIRTLPHGDAMAWVDWSDLIGAGLERRIDDVLAEERAHGLASGRTFEWKLYHHDAPADLLHRLEAAGYRPGEPEAVVVVPVADACDALRVRGEREAPTDAVRALRAADLADADRDAFFEGLRAIYRAVYDDPFDGFATRLAGQQADAPHEIDLVLLEWEGRPASVGWTWYRADSPFATLWGGATVPEARGRGLYHRLLRERLDEAARRGRSLASVDAGPMSRPILERLGFRTVAWTTPCVAQPA
jgi:GNAT superfamily N-acetyltransferase